MTYGGKRVQLDDVLEILGWPTPSWCSTPREALVEHDPKAALGAVQRLSDSGATSPSSCATCRAICATCSSCRRSAKSPTRSPSPPSTRTAWFPGGAAGAGRDTARDRLSGGGDRGGQGRLRASHPARAGAAQGHSAAVGPLAPGADVPHRAARGRAPRAGAPAGSGELADLLRRRRPTRARARRRRRARLPAPQPPSRSTPTTSRRRRWTSIGAGALARGRGGRRRRTECSARPWAARPGRLDGNA